MGLSVESGMASIVKSGLEDLNNRKDDLMKKMSDIRSGNVEDQTTALLMVQFEMGQYNAMQEAVSNFAKSITDTAKSISQKV